MGGNGALPARTRGQTEKYAKNSCPPPERIRRPVSWGIAYRCARGMEPIGAYRGRCRDLAWMRAYKPGRTAEAWRQKRTQSCRLTRRASPSVRTWNVTAKSYGREIERERPDGILLFGRSNLKRLSDRSSRSIRTALPHPTYLKGRCSSVKQTMPGYVDPRQKIFFNRDEGVLNCFQPGRLAFKTTRECSVVAANSSMSTAAYQTKASVRAGYVIHNSQRADEFPRGIRIIGLRNLFQDRKSCRTQINAVGSTSSATPDQNSSITSAIWRWAGSFVR